MGRGDTLLNAVIGAVVSVILAFLPFSPILGGGVAGYLQKGTLEDGLRVGAISGLITMLPLFAIASLFGGVLLGLVGINPAAAFGFGAFLMVVIGFLLLYTVALSAVGGYVGVYLAKETDVG